MKFKKILQSWILFSAFIFFFSFSLKGQGPIFQIECIGKYTIKITVEGTLPNVSPPAKNYRPYMLILVDIFKENLEVSISDGLSDFINDSSKFPANNTLTQRVLGTFDSYDIVFEEENSDPLIVGKQIKGQVFLTFTGKAFATPGAKLDDILKPCGTTGEVKWGNPAAKDNVGQWIRVCCGCGG